MVMRRNKKSKRKAESGTNQGSDKPSKLALLGSTDEIDEMSKHPKHDEESLEHELIKMEIDSDSESPFKSTPTEDAEMQDVSDQRKQELKNTEIDESFVKNARIARKPKNVNLLLSTIDEMGIEDVGGLLNYAKTVSVEQMKEKLGDGPGANVYAFLQQNFPDEMKQAATVTKPVALLDATWYENPKNTFEKYVSTNKKQINDELINWKLAPAIAKIANESKVMNDEASHLASIVQNTIMRLGKQLVVDRSKKYPNVDLETVLNDYIIYPPLSQDEIHEINAEHKKRYPDAKVEYLGNEIYSYEYSTKFSSLRGESNTLFTRYDSRNIVDTALWIAEDRINPDGTVNQDKYYHAAIIGNPGIGKSFNLLYAIQKLTGKGKPFIYCDRKEGYSYLFLMDPETGKYQAWVCTDKPNSMNLSTFEGDKDVHILIDPDEKGTDVPISAKAFVLLACSANTKHYHNLNKNGMRYLYTTNWSLEEILTVHTHFEVKEWKELKPEEVKHEIAQRFKVVGGGPRYIFATDTDFAKRKGVVESIVLPEDVLKQCLAGNSVNFSVRQDKGIPSSMFRIDGYSGEADKQFVDFDPDRIRVAKNSISFIPYSNNQVGILSERALELLHKNHRLSLLESFEHGKSSDRGFLFETFVKLDLMKQSRFSVYSFPDSNNQSQSGSFTGSEFDAYMKKDLKDLKEVAESMKIAITGSKSEIAELIIEKELKRYMRHRKDKLKEIANLKKVSSDGDKIDIASRILGLNDTQLLGSSRNKGTLELEAATLDKCYLKEDVFKFLKSPPPSPSRRKLLIAPYAFPCFDFIDSPCRWYQTTLDKNHTLSVSWTLKMAKMIGLVDQDNNGVYQLQQGEENNEKIIIYICIPEYLLSSFNSPMKLDGGTQEEKDLVHRITEQKVLVIPEEDPAY